MRYLDAVTHFFPSRFFDMMLEAPGFSGRFGGYGYGYGHGGVGVIGVILIVLVVLLLTGRL